jgi:hypothetical protein
MTKSVPSQNPSYSKLILRFQGPRQKKTDEKAASPSACAIGAFIGLHGQKHI